MTSLIEPIFDPIGDQLACLSPRPRREEDGESDNKTPEADEFSLLDMVPPVMVNAVGSLAPSGNWLESPGGTVWRRA